MDQAVNDLTLPKHRIGRAERIVFTGERRDFFRLVRPGALLELITGGFYRFWLATDIRRFLWSSTSIEGHGFEYAGTAKELLIGFLFALAILAPIYLAYFLIGIEAERAKAFASIPLILFFYAFSQFAIFRARRYRATRTVWRGVRFWMSGSGWAYSWRACLWGVFALLTLGLALHARARWSVTKCAICITATCRRVSTERAGSSSSKPGGCGFCLCRSSRCR